VREETEALCFLPHVGGGGPASCMAEGGAATGAFEGGAALRARGMVAVQNV
jgi:hypothetical protein